MPSSDITNAMSDLRTALDALSVSGDCVAEMEAVDDKFDELGAALDVLATCLGLGGGGAGNPPSAP